MNPYRLNSPREQRTTRQTQSRMRRALLEDLEQRCLLSFYNPRGFSPAAGPNGAPVEGVAFTATVAETASTTAVTATNLSATIDWGDGGAPIAYGAGVGITQTGAEQSPFGTLFDWSVTETHTYAEATAPGASHPITITLVDALDPTAPVVIHTSTAVAEAPLTAGAVVPATPIQEGFVVLSSAQLFDFTDGNLTATPGDFTATVDWGDGTPTSTGVVGQFGPGSFFVTSGGHVYAETGTYKIKITVKDNDPGGSQIQSAPSGNITVSDAALSSSGQLPIPVNAAEGQLLAGIPLGTFLDANPLATAADFTGSIDWGDSTPADVATFTPVGIVGGQSKWLVTGSHTYTKASGSPFTVKVTVSDEDGSALAGGLSTTATVTQSPLSVQVLSLHTTAGSPNIPAGTPIAILNDAGGKDPLADYSATINWGDGTTETVPGTMFTPGVGSSLVIGALGTHGYAKPGLYPITVTVTDSDPAVGVGNGFALVAPAPLTKTGDFNGGAPLAATEGIALPSNTQFVTFTYGDASATKSDFVAAIDWGDGTGIQAGTVTGGAGAFGVTAGHTYAEKGTYTINYTVTDPFGQRITGTGTVNVADGLLSPSGQAPIPIHAAEGQPLSNIPLGTFADANPNATADDFTGIIGWGDGTPLDLATFTRVGTNGAGQSVWLVTGNHTFAHATGAPFAVTVSVGDKDGSTLAGGLTTTATVVQTPLAVSVPALTPTTPASVPAGTVIGSFSDNAGADMLANYSASFNWGDGTVFSTGGGQLTIVAGVNPNTFNVQTTAAHTYAKPGLYPTTLTVNDSDPAQGIGNGFALVAPATLTKTGDLNGGGLSPIEGVAIPSNTQFITFTYGNPAATTSDFVATIDWGDGTGIQAGTVTGGAGAFGATAGHTYAEPGTYTVNYTVTDPFGQRITGTGTITVKDGALSGGGQGPIAVNATEGQHLSNIALGTFLDQNPNATQDDFTGVITWGDGSPPDFATFTRVGQSGGQSLWLVTGNHTFTHATAAPFTVSVGITDRDSGVVFPAAQLTLTTTATIVQTPLAVSVPGLTPTAAATVAAGTVIGSFSDNAGADMLANYSASFNWGDGTVFSTGGGQLTIVAGVNPNTFNVQTTAAHTYAKPGLYPTTLTVNDSDPAQGIGNGFALVAPATLTKTADFNGGAPFAATEGIAIPSNTQFVTFTYGDPTATASDFVATIDWGDGTGTQAGTVHLLAPGSFGVTAGHTYAEAGTYTINYTVTDPFGQRITGTGTINVADAALSNGTAINVTGTEDQNLVNVPVAVFVDANPLATPADIIASIDWGDGSGQVPGIVTKIGAAPDGSSIFEVSGTHTYTTSVGSPFTMTVNIADEDTYATNGHVPQIVLHPTATITAGAIDVTVLPIVATSGTPTGTGTPGMPTASNELVATFTDTTGADALGNYSATIDWGDGTIDSGAAVTIQPLGGGQFGVYGTHTYANAGLFRVVVTVNDSDPATGVGANLAIVLPAATIITITPAPGPPLGVLPSGTEGAPLAPTPGLPAGAAGTELATVTVSVPAQPASNYSVQIDWGDGSPQSAGQIVPDTTADAADPTHSHFIVTGTHTYLEARTAPYIITVFVTQNLPNVAPFESDTTVHTTDSITVNDALLTPGIAAPIFGTENQPLNNVLVGTFTDANPFATAADFSATINWGDGSGIDSNAQIHLISGTPTGAVFGVYGSHVYKTLGGNNGLFSTEVTVLDEDSPVGASISVPPVAGNNVTISQSPIIVTVLPQQATVNAPTALGTVVATFVDNAGAGSDPLGNYTATIDWGDGSMTAMGDIHDLGGGQYSVTAPVTGHTYTKVGTYVLKVTVHDSDPADGIGAALVIVQNSVIVATPTPGPIVNPATGTPYNEGQPLTNVTLATLTDTDTTATAANYTVQIDWGDGSPQSAGTVMPDTTADAADPTHHHFIIQGSHTYAEANPAGYNVQLIVTNATGGKTTASLTIAVADAPLSDAVGLPIYATEFMPLNDIPVATFVDANPLGTAGDFSATINWGDGSALDHNARILLVGANPNGPGLQYAVYGSHVYSKVTPPGSPFLTEITIKDEDGQSIATTPATVTVGVNASPLVIFPAPLTAVENVPLPTGQTIPPQNGTNPPTIVATFYDTAGPDPLTAYTAMIDWGNGTGSTPDTVTAATILQNGTNFVILAPAGAMVTYPEEGNYTVRVALTDANGNITAYAIDPITVADGKLTPAAPQPTIPAQTQGVPSGLIPIAAFNDQNPLAPASEFTATIDWGDGSPQSAGQVTQSAGPGSTFIVSGNHTYAQPSTGAGYTITVHVVDEGGASVNLTRTVTVNASVITVTPGHFDAVEGQPVTNVVVATFTDTGGAGPIGSYTASINWNDGTPPTVTPGQIVALGGNQFEVLGSLPDGYPEEGTFNVFVTITHNGVTVPGSPFTATADVADAPLQGTAVPVNAKEGTTFTGPVAHFTDLDPNGTPSDYTVTIDWGDGSPTSSGTVTGPTGGPFVVSAPAGGHLYTEEGTYTLSITVTDHNASFTATEQVTVADTAPVPNNPQPTVNVNEGALFSGPVARFQEIYGTFAEPASDFTATIDWGDGSAASTGAIVSTGTPGVYEVVGSHVYANLGNTIGGSPTNPTGTFNIIVTIHDDGGTSLTIMNPATVNEVPVMVTGQLDAGSDSGKFHNDGITNVSQPTFFGTTEPFHHVKLYATPTGGGAPILIGQTEALSDGSWRIISNRLPDGTYAITATGQDQGGLPIQPAVFPITAATATGSNILTIDTIGPRVTNAAFDRATGTVTLSFQDFGPSASGLLAQSLADAANYAFNNQLARPLGRYIIGAIDVSPGSGTGEQTVALSIVSTRFGQPLSSRLLRGFFQIIARAASVTNPSGIQDVAGNGLDGEFYGPGSASGNGVPGGDFVANFNNFHNIVNPPATVIGTPHPNDPAGHFRRTPVRRPVVHHVISRHHR